MCSTVCQVAFEKAKKMLTSNLALTHFDPSKEIIASEYEL